MSAIRNAFPHPRASRASSPDDGRGVHQGLRGRRGAGYDGSMTTPTAPGAAPADVPQNNVPEFTVAQISTALQRTIEGAFSRVRVRGEVSGFKRAPSGHLYFSLKDTDAVIDACCWKQTAGRLALRPEDGM